MFTKYLLNMMAYDKMQVVLSLDNNIIAKRVVSCENKHCVNFIYLMIT